MTGSLVLLLLYSSAVYPQQNEGCGPIPLEQTPKLCISNPSTGFIYPKKAKAAGIEGTVLVLAQINNSGRVDLVLALSGPEPLRQAALDAVKAWVYRPYLLDGSPTGFRTVISVKFTIEKPPAKSRRHS